MIDSRQSSPARAQTATWAIAIVSALVLVAFIARVADIDRLPLHFDEGINIFFGHRSPAEVLDWTIKTYDNDPPGHRLTLGIWMALAGPTPFAIRILSIFFGVLTVAATYRLARRLRLPLAPALIAAGLMAVSPFAVEYTQQAKGYAMGAGMAALSWLAWMRLVKGNPGRRRLGAAIVYVLTTALALSTHYYVIPLLALQWVWFIGAHLHVPPRAWVFGPATRRGLVFQFLAALPMAIWLGLMASSLLVSTARSSTKFEPPSPLVVVRDILGEMSLGSTAGPTLATAGALVTLVLAVLGAVQLWRRRDDGRPGFWFGASLALLILGTVVLTQRVTFFGPRFLLYAMPNLCIWIAGVAVRPGVFLRRGEASPLNLARHRFGGDASPLHTANTWRLVALGAAAVLCMIGLASFYQSPSDRPTSFRTLIKESRPLFKANDALLGTYIWMEGMLTSYAPETAGQMSWHEGALSLDGADSALSPIAQNHPRIWVLTYGGNPSAPDSPSIHWLKTNAALASETRTDDASLLLFDATDAPVRQPPAATARATFSGAIQLDYTPVSQTVGWGDTIPLQLVWTTSQPITEHLVVFAHLISPDGQLVAQSDGDPVNGLAPSFTWTPNVPVIGRHALLVGGALPPGDYVVRVGLYRQDDQTRVLTSTGADAVEVGVVTMR